MRDNNAAYRGYKKTMRRLLPAVLSGLLLTAAFPRWNFAAAAWVALVPLLYSLRNVSSWKSFGPGFAAGLVHYLTLGYWLMPTLKNYGGLPLPAALIFSLLLAAYLAIYIGVFAMIVTGIRSGPAITLLTAPAAWVTLEYIRTFLFTGFPWELLGYSQYQQLSLIQLADLTGVYGLSFVIVLVNTALFLAGLALLQKKWQEVRVKKRPALAAVLGALILVAVVWGYGQWRLSRVGQDMSRAEHHRLAVIQGNIDQSLKWDEEFRLDSVRKYLDLAARPEARRADLVVMPETAMPFYFNYDKNLAAMVSRFARDQEIHLLTGAPTVFSQGNDYELYNSAYLIAPTGEVTGRYDKSHLVPFGEYVPLGKWLPLIDRLVVAVGDFEPGDPGRVLNLDNRRLGIQICYEIIFPGGCRQLVAGGADIIINITNDAWYGRTGAPYQHFSMTVLRAVENRRAVVRAANTGISGWVDPRGRIRDATSIFVESVRSYQVPEGRGQTVYGRLGDLFAKFCVIATLFVLWRKYRINR